MCGIVGLHGPQDELWIQQMNRAQRHRGPDGQGVYQDGDLHLGMTRLSIVDIAGGRQPMRTPDGNYVIVYNGEIYNAPELRRELASAGEVFSTDHSDTEVLLRLVARDGASGLGRLNGMFAFALYDRRRRRVLCARDRFGIKPFHYTLQRGRFAFASELKALLTLPFITREIDRQSLFDYLSLMFVPGEHTIFKGLLRLPPAHLLTYELDARRITVERWWSPSYAYDQAIPEAEWPLRVAATLATAVKRWSRADVPIACSLSGGLDSSSIVATLAQSGVPVRTYSLGFTAPGEDEWNELPLARAVAEQYGTDHNEIVLRPETLLAALREMVFHLDEPYGGGLPSWSVFAFMSESVKVGLTGTGGDELFGNYGKWRSLEPRLLTQLFRARSLGDRFRTGFFDRFYYFADTDKREILGSWAEEARDTSSLLFERFASAPTESVRDKAAYTDLGTQLPEEFLLMTDRFSMAHSLEARTPFLDAELVDLVHTIPPRVRTHRRDLKGLLRRAVGPLLPRSVIRARKRGFVIPTGKWLRSDLRTTCEHLLARDRLAAQGLFRPSFYDQYVAPHLSGHEDHTPKVWGAVMFQLWHSNVFEGGAGAETLSGAA